MDNKINLCIIVPNLNNDRLFKNKLLIDELSNSFNIKLVVLSGNNDDGFKLNNKEPIYLGIDQSDSILKYPLNYYQNINCCFLNLIPRARDWLYLLPGSIFLLCSLVF